MERQNADLGRSVLRVNVDETSICRDPGDTKGLIISKHAQTQPVIVQNKPPARGSFTQVTFVCDNTTFQPRLPQLIIGNKNILLKKDLARLRPTLPTNVYVIREASSWVNASIFAAALKWLRQGVDQIQKNVHVLLLMDCSNVHLNSSVLNTARRYNISVCFVPTSLTWLLQPCDTHVFHILKAFIRKRFHEKRLHTTGGTVSTLDLLQIVVLAVRKVLQANQWSTAFNKNGYAADHKNISDRIVRALQLELPLNLAAVDPPPQDKQLILPAKKTVAPRHLQVSAHGSHEQPKPRAKLLKKQSSLTPGDANNEYPGHQTAAQLTPWNLRPRHRRSTHPTAASSSDPVPAPYVPAAPTTGPCPLLTPSARATTARTQTRARAIPPPKKPRLTAPRRA